MDERYQNKEIVRIWGNENKLLLWQETELAAILAMVNLGQIAKRIFDRIKKVWLEMPIDITWWKKRDKEIHHDLNAFIDERVWHLENELHEFVHKKLTSFDTQEPAFATMIIESLKIVENSYMIVENALIYLSRRYRFTIMNARTHGQEAELQTFGARCLTWLKQLRTVRAELESAKENLRYSKLSGAIGKYGSIDPALEKEALKILGFKPFFGATQIMPRVVYAPVAQAISNMVQVLNNIALDIRLNARSPRPLMREPFKKKQKGSSAMPQKRNPIRLEQVKGMARMASGYLNMILQNIETWEERAIEQSCVERVAWPDLFHVAIQSLKVMSYCLSELKVYPDNMIQEVYESRGTYASSEVKEFLKKHFIKHGLGYEDAYRTVQLACFNVFEPNEKRLVLREKISSSLEGSKKLISLMEYLEPQKIISIEELIPQASLKESDELDISAEEVDRYNQVLTIIFSDGDILAEWNQLFDPTFLLKNEAVLYREILGD